MKTFLFMGPLVVGLVMTSTTPAGQAPGWPTRGWLMAEPAAVKLDAAALDAFDRELAAGRHGYVDGMLVVRQGKLAYERSYRHDYQALFAGKGEPGMYNYYDPAWHPYYKATPLHTMQSVSKSVTSALIGIAIARGDIKSVDVPVMPYFSSFRVTPDPRRDRMRLRHVLTMTTGIAWDESTVPYTDPKNNCAAMEASRDWIQYVLDQPMATDPGTAFVYNSGATELLAHILKQATGQQADDYAREHLFKPLGIEFYWKRTPTGLPDTEGGLYLQPRDLAKIGYLYLKDGMWDGRRILPAGWVAQSTRWIVDAGTVSRGYGYKWWVLSRQTASNPEAYAGLGYGGQFLIVVPERDLVAVFTGWNIYGSPQLSVQTALARVLAAAE